MSKPQRLNKADALTHWRQLPARDPAPLMRAIPYKQEGSKYGACGIRIDGTRPFIDAVLSQLTTLLGHENAETRLELNYTETADRETGYPTGQWVCYIRVHERGDEAKMVNAVASAMARKEVILSRGY